MLTDKLPVHKSVDLMARCVHIQLVSSLSLVLEAVMCQIFYRIPLIR